MPDSNPADPVDRDIDLDRLAALCSVGAVPIPDDLSENDLKQLYRLIARKRRIRLVDFFARSIAEDFCTERLSRGKDNAQENI